MNFIVILIVILILAVLGKRLSRKNFSCTRHRPNLCLLASGVLPASERAALERHLAACPDCRTYFAEIQSVTASLEKLPAAQARATKPGRRRAATPFACGAGTLRRGFPQNSRMIQALGDTGNDGFLSVGGGPPPSASLAAVVAAARPLPRGGRRSSGLIAGSGPAWPPPGC